MSYMCVTDVLLYCNQSYKYAAVKPELHLYVLSKSDIDPISIRCQSGINPVLIRCQSDVNLMSI